MSSYVPTRLLPADKAVRIKKENLLCLADNNVFIKAIDKAFSSKCPNREVDLVKIKAMKECVKATTGSVTKASLRKSVFYAVQENGVTLTPESWDSCIEYYEDRMDLLIETGADISKLRETELWLASLYEPVNVNDYDACYKWCVFQYIKITKGMCGYTPPKCEKILATVLPSSLTTEWFDQQASIIAYVAKCCKITHRDLKNAYETACKSI